MATEKQIHANRKNAQNSTGPKTPQGKATAAKNATKHGLTAQNILIKGENLEDFQEHRDKLTHELNPIFQTEVIITDRIVNLSWQLKRCAHLQAAALDYIINNERFADSENALGKAVFAGFAQTRALDRLIMYERRIENSLYKSMKQLDNLKQITAKQKAESEKDLRRARAETRTLNKSRNEMSAYEYAKTNMQNKPNPPLITTPQHQDSTKTPFSPRTEVRGFTDSPHPHQPITQNEPNSQPANLQTSTQNRQYGITPREHRT